MVPTKPQGKPKGSNAVRPAGQQGQHVTGLSEDEGNGGQIKQYINWDDIPDEKTTSNGAGAVQSQSPTKASSLFSNDDNNEDYWAQPQPYVNSKQDNTAPSDAAGNNNTSHFGRPQQMVDQTDHWAASPRKPQAQPQRAISPVLQSQHHHHQQQQQQQQQYHQHQQPMRRNGEYEGHRERTRGREKAEEGEIDHSY